MWNQPVTKIKIDMPQRLLINKRGRTISVLADKVKELVDKGFIVAPQDALLGKYYPEHDQAVNKTPSVATPTPPKTVDIPVAPSMPKEADVEPVQRSSTPKPKSKKLGGKRFSRRTSKPTA